MVFNFSEGGWAALTTGSTGKGKELDDIDDVTAAKMTKSAAADFDVIAGKDGRRRRRGGGGPLWRQCCG